MNEVKQQQKLDGAYALSPPVHHWSHDQRDAKACKSMGEEGELAKNSPKVQLNA